MRTKNQYKLIMILGVYIFLEQIIMKFLISINMILRTINIEWNLYSFGIVALPDDVIKVAGFVYPIIIIILIYYFVKVMIELYTKNIVRDETKKDNVSLVEEEPQLK